MKRKLACLLLITATLVTNLSIAWADESAGAAASDNAASTEALAQLSAAGVDSVSTAITDNKGMNLAIDLAGAREWERDWSPSVSGGADDSSPIRWSQGNDEGFSPSVRCADSSLIRGSQEVTA